CESGDGLEQGCQFLRGRSIKTRIGALGQPREIAEGSFDMRIAPFLEDEERQAQKAELSGFFGKIIDIFLDGVAHIDDRIDAPLGVFATGTSKDLGYLGIAVPVYDITPLLCQTM